MDGWRQWIDVGDDDLAAEVESAERTAKGLHERHAA
jgi:hypothetical protein